MKLKCVFREQTLTDIGDEHDALKVNNARLINETVAVFLSGLLDLTTL